MTRQPCDSRKSEVIVPRCRRGRTLPARGTHEPTTRWPDRRARVLKNEGVSHVFTLCGGHVMSIYDGCIEENIRVVDTRHEQTAGHAADGWSRVTGQPGVAKVTAGARG